MTIAQRCCPPQPEAMLAMYVLEAEPVLSTRLVCCQGLITLRQRYIKKLWLMKYCLLSGVAVKAFV